MKQNREPRNNPTYFQPTFFFYRDYKNIHWKRKISSINGARKSGYSYIEKKNLVSDISFSTKTKVDKRLTC